MVKSKKRIVKSIESYKELIKEHKEKKDSYSGPKEYLREYWDKQIEVFEEEIKKQKDKLEKL